MTERSSTRSFAGGVNTRLHEIPDKAAFGVATDIVVSG